MSNYSRHSRGMSAAPGLSVVIYDGAGTTVVEQIDEVQSLGVRWDLDRFGLQRFEFTAPARGLMNIYDAYKDRLGYWAAIFDVDTSAPVADGWVYEVQLRGRASVTYACAGAALRLYDQYETNNPAAGTVTTDAYLKSVLTAHAPHVSSNQANIASTGSTMGTVWAVDTLVTTGGTATVGSTVGDIIRDIRDIGTSTAGEILDFWLEPARVSSNIYPQAATPYLAVRVSAGTADWRVSVQDLTNVRMSRDIWDWTSDVDVFHGAGGTAVPTATADTTHGTRMRRERRADMDATQAAQYADVLLGALNSPKPELSFTIGSGWIRNSVGAKTPVWDMLRSPGYILIDDLFPTDDILDLTRDGALVFRIVALDYDHNARTMRVVPETYLGDRKLDVVLQQLGANVGQGIQRGT